ncbi:hypothetical protein ACFQGT_01495 [Natrialbaceae archaeon GCM10025810]|uniref:hypothetical protein n=1 Tax=Halovalidus salilacus TaxID=3075124 RepID=UPI0036194036
MNRRSTSNARTERSAEAEPPTEAETETDRRRPRRSVTANTDVHVPQKPQSRRAQYQQLGLQFGALFVVLGAGSAAVDGLLAYNAALTGIGALLVGLSFPTRDLLARDE